MTLIIDKSKKNAKSYAANLCSMGMLAYGCMPSEAFLELDIKYRAVVITSAEDILDLRDYVRHLRAYTGKIPIFAMRNTPSQKPSHIAFDSVEGKNFDKILYYPEPSADMVYEMAVYCKSKGVSIPGDYRLCGINAVADTACVHYFKDAVKLTRTETMILRYIIRAYPRICKASEISKYIFDVKDDGFSSRVRTHISCINQKIRNACNRKGIVNLHGKGYVIMTPILKEILEKKEAARMQ